MEWKNELSKFLNANFSHLKKKEKVDRAEAITATEHFLEKTDCEAPYNEAVEYACTFFEIVSDVEAA